VNQETYEQRREREERERKAKAAARAVLQRELPNVQIDDEVWTATSTEDSRRHKTYTRTVRVGVTVYIRDWKAKQRLEDSFGQGYLPEGVYAQSYFGLIRDAIREAFDGAPWPCKVKHETDGTSSTYGDRREAGWDYRISFYLSATYRAPKPSKIPSEDELLSWLGGANNIGARICQGIEAGFAKGKALAEAIERARIANLVLNDYVERVDEAAKTNVRYKQRLAALNAEYEAEREVQCAKLLAELGDKCGVSWEDAPDFEPDPRSTAAAKAKLPERVARLLAPSRRGRGLPSLSSESYDIKAADVE
jgi:hypothetical protein